MKNTKNSNMMVKYVCECRGEKINVGIDTKCCSKCGYKNPDCKSIETKCSICGSVAMKDEWGNGECNNCGWKFSVDELEMENYWGISYPLLVSPTTAREQFKNGKPFKATFDEFINGLKFYSEMTITHNGISYGALFYKDKSKQYKNTKEIDGNVEFFENKVEDSVQYFKTIKDFKNNAKINGKLIKDIWNEIDFAGFMYCE